MSRLHRTKEQVPEEMETKLIRCRTRCIVYVTIIDMYKSGTSKLLVFARDHTYTKQLSSPATRPRTIRMPPPLVYMSLEIDRWLVECSMLYFMPSTHKRLVASDDKLLRVMVHCYWCCRNAVWLESQGAHVLV